MLFEADAVGLIFSDNGDAGGNIQRQDGLARFGSFGVFSRRRRRCLSLVTCREKERRKKDVIDGVFLRHRFCS